MEAMTLINSENKRIHRLNVALKIIGIITLIITIIFLIVIVIIITDSVSKINIAIGQMVSNGNNITNSIYKIKNDAAIGLFIFKQLSKEGSNDTQVMLNYIQSISKDLNKIANTI